MDIEQEITDTKGEIAALKGKLAKVEDKIAPLEEKRARKEALEEEEKKDLDRLWDKEKDLNAQLTSLQGQLEKLYGERFKANPAPSAPAEQPFKRAKTISTMEDAEGFISNLIPDHFFKENNSITLKTWKGTQFTASQKNAGSIDLLLDRLPGSSDGGLSLLSDIFSSYTQDVGILSAPSGSGKTRAVLEYLSMNWGLYFVAATEGNGGSEDLFTASGAISKDCSSSSKDTQVVVSGHCSKLLHLRLLILSRLLALKPNLTPFEWLLLQLYPKNYFGKDVFFVAWSNVLNLEVDPSNVLALLCEIEGLLGRKIVAFIDEAQEMVKKVGPFVSSEGDEARPLLSPVSRICKSVLQTFFVGTGVEMLNSLMWSSHSMKVVNFSTSPVSSGYFEAAFAWEHYVGKYLPDKEKTAFQEEVFPKLQGRARFFAVFIQTYLEAGENVDAMDAFKVARSLALGPSNISLVSQLSRISSVAATEINLIRNIANAFFFGSPLSLPSDIVKKVVNAGLANFDEKGEPREPLFKEAMFLYFRQHLQEEYLVLQISSMDIASAQGFEFETLFALRLFSRMETTQQSGGSLAVALDLDTPFRLGKCQDSDLMGLLDCPFSFLPEGNTVAPLLTRAKNCTLQAYIAQKKSYFFSSPQGSESDVVIVVKLDTKCLPATLTKGLASDLFAIGIQIKLYGPNTKLQKSQSTEMMKIFETTNIQEKNPEVPLAGVLRFLAPLGSVVKGGVGQLRAQGYNAAAYPGVGLPNELCPDYISVLSYHNLQPTEGQPRAIFTPRERDWIWKKIEGE